MQLIKQQWYFSSSGMLEKLQKELIAGGYTADTPAAMFIKPHGLMRKYAVAQ